MKYSKYNKISQIFQYASVIEFSLLKPGNVSPYMLDKESYDEFVKSAISLDFIYREVCKSGSKGNPLVFNFVYNIIKRQGKKFKLFGTIVTEIPLVYVSCKNEYSSIYDLVKDASNFIQSNYDVNNTFYFIESLKLLNPSYLGKLYEYFDYKKSDVVKLPLYELLKISSYEDIVARNIVSGYNYTVKVYKELIEGIKSFHESIMKSYIDLLLGAGDAIVFKGRGVFTLTEIRNIVKYNRERLLHDLNYILKLDRWLSKMNIKLGSIADIIASGIALYYFDEFLIKRDG